MEHLVAEEADIEPQDLVETKDGDSEFWIYTGTGLQTDIILDGK